MKEKNCALCNEKTNQIIKHHLVPKSKGGAKGETIQCCRMCAEMVHMLHTDKELAAMTVAELKGSEKMARYLKWRQNHLGEYTVRMSGKVKQYRRYHR